MSKDEIKQLAKEIAAEAIAETQEAFAIMINEREEENNRALHVVIESMRDEFKVYGDSIVDLNAKFGKISGRLDSIDNRLDAIDSRLDGIDGRLDAIDSRLDGIDGRLYHLEGDVGQIKTYIFDNVEPRMYKIEMDTCGTVYAK